MPSDIHLDGNALGGLFRDVFGREMTDQEGCCEACGTVSVLASVMVYRGAGDVVRCPACGSVLIVIVSSPSGYRVSLESLRWLSVKRADG